MSTPPRFRSRSLLHLLPALVALAAVAIAGAPTRVASAQVPPTRFYGVVTILGEIAPAGTEVKGFVNGQECGSTVIAGDDGFYILDVAHTASVPGCAADDGDLVSFSINGAPADQVAGFMQGGFVEVNLTPVETPSE